MSKSELTYKKKREIVSERFALLLNSTKRLKKPESLAKVKKAFHFADKAHEGQFRKTGYKLPFIVHPIAVAKIIAEEMGFGSTTIAAALLHDVVEDTEYTIENIRTNFGDEIALIVDGMTKITHVFNPDRTEQAATFINLIMKISEDRRIAFVKIADRLHNLRTMSGIRESSQMIKTGESLDVFAPLAHQLGLFEIRKEIEDISFKLREPDEYREISELAQESKGEREKFFESLSAPISDILKKNNYKFDIKPVTKSLYRTRQTIKTKKIKFNEIHNFLSLRLIFKPDNNLSEKQQCYVLYALLTDLFAIKENEFKDWVTNPRSNGFEALITKVLLEGDWAEVQIMTERMNQIAERGYAKSQENIHTKNLDKWIRSMGKNLKDKTLTNQEVLGMVSPEDDEIHVFTPRGDLVTLPAGATTLDFAFRIHTDLGLHFVVAEVNRKTVSYDFKLNYADQVKIISSDKAKPIEDWEDFLVCPRNKAELRRYFNKKRNKQIKKGKKIYEEIIDKLELCDQDISRLINHFHCKDKRDFYYKIRNQLILLEHINLYINKKEGFKKKLINLFVTESESESEDKEIWIDEFKSKEPFFVTNLNDVTFAHCCNPLAGESSMVYRTSQLEYVVHRKDCKVARELNSSDGKNTTVVEWGNLKKEEFRAKIKFNGIDRKRLLSEILLIISDEMNINVAALVIRAEKNIFRGTIELLVANIDNLQNIIDLIKKVKGIKKIYRSR